MPSASSSRTRSTSNKRSSKMSSSQRPFFLSSFLAAFRQQTPSGGSLSASSQSSKSHTHPQSPASAAGGSAAGSSGSSSVASSSQPHPIPQQGRPGGGVMNQLHSPRTHGGIPIPGAGSPGRRRGSDSSSEGFRDAMGGEKWYIGGRTAGGEEKYFKLGVVRRIKSQDRLSLDRLSL